MTTAAIQPGLTGRVAIVTGGRRGIGAAVCDALAAEGARVAIFDRTDGKDPDSAASSYIVDVCDQGAIDSAVGDVERTLGPVSILVNNAGILFPATVLDTADHEWAETMRVNAEGTFRMSRAVGRLMVERRNGCIVTVASNAASTPRAGMAAYCASKAASAMVTKVLGLELAPYGIRCNVVAPGSTETEMQRRFWTDKLGPEQVVAGSPEHFRLGIPLGRIADPADVAAAVVFLASDSARHITMQQLVVDGGATLGA